MDGHGLLLTARGWTDSGLMTFFFVVGLEARREFDIPGRRGRGVRRPERCGGHSTFFANGRRLYGANTLRATRASYGGDSALAGGPAVFRLRSLLARRVPGLLTRPVREAPCVGLRACRVGMRLPTRRAAA
ncbi:hypothetical protein Shyhy01_21510 [Streptomyces hygroscopicus subsp. hygroscopicus]|nr:hypothetical protein Shyhy01_21510 [Streptomyces hygroscopicus subsp. hygroscopicus]